MAELSFLPKLLLQHDSSPDSVLEDVRSAFLQAAQQRTVQASVSPSGDGLAVALGQRLVVMHSWAGGFGASAVEFVSAVDAPETVTALCWLAAGGQSTDECLLVGTSTGFLQLHSAATGALLLRQQLHHTAIVAAAVRWSGCGSDPEDLSEDVTLCCADAIVRLPAWEVWAAVRWRAGQAAGRSGWWGGSGGSATSPSAQHQLTFSKFTLPRGTGPRTAALCLGPPPPTLYAALTARGGGQQQRSRLHIITAGTSPPLSAYEGEESAAPGLLSLVSDLASTTAASLLGRARAYVPGGGAGRSLLGGLRRGGGGGATASSSSSSSLSSDADGVQQGHKKRQEKVPGEPASLAAAVWDEKRSITQMAPSPCGRWAACCDSLGRVLLVDATSTLVVRMLKGYRDAQVAWLVCGGDTSGSGGNALHDGTRHSGLAPAGDSSSSLGSLSTSAPASLCGSSVNLVAAEAAAAAAASPQQPEAGVGQAEAAARAEVAHQPFPAATQQQQQAGRRGSWQQLLVAYAPRRAVVELWEPHSLTRVGSLRCSTQLGLLLQQPARRAGDSAWSANKCLLLDASALTLADLTAQLTALIV